MKYIEELNSGDCFVTDKEYFVLTSDHKKNGQRLCYSLQDGSARWFDGNFGVDHEPVYVLDKENNIVAIKITKKDDNH